MLNFFWGKKSTISSIGSLAFLKMVAGCFLMACKSICYIKLVKGWKGAFQTTNQHVKKKNQIANTIFIPLSTYLHKKDPVIKIWIIYNLIQKVKLINPTFDTFKFKAFKGVLFMSNSVSHCLLFNAFYLQTINSIPKESHE